MVASTFDKISPLYDVIERYVLRDYPGSLELLRQYITCLPSDKIIDIGGGTGYFAEYLLNSVNRVVVLDPSRKMLIRQVNPNMDLIQSIGEYIAIRSTSFDLALLINTLHHIQREYQSMVLSEIFRILRPGGRLFIIESFPQKSFLFSIFNKIEQVVSGLTFHITPGELEQKLVTIGFSIESNIHPTNHDWKYVLSAIK